MNYLLAAIAALVPTSCEDDIWKDYQAAIERSWESYTGRQGIWDRPFENACVIVGLQKGRLVQRVSTQIEQLDRLEGFRKTKIRGVEAIV